MKRKESHAIPFAFSGALLVAAVAAFTTKTLPFTRISTITPTDNPDNALTSLHATTTPTPRSNQFQKWIEDIFPSTATDTQTKNRQMSQTDSPTDPKSNSGKIVRCASRSYQKTASTPSSNQYTTKKDEMAFVNLTPEGVVGDYNHYRTKALSGTRDRAVSILTTDVFKSVLNRKKEVAAYLSSIQPGDLGENILIDGLDYRFFRVGSRYRLGGEKKDGDSSGGVIVEITEPIVPCANLCKLPYINDDRLKPPQRIERCQNFLNVLGESDGLRGWYGKIIGGGGVVRIGDNVAPLMA